MIGSKPQILVKSIRTDQFTRVHFPIRVPKRLELAESLHEFRPKHFWKQFAAGLAISMFTGDRAPVADHEIGGLFHKPPELANTFSRLEIVIHARMHTGMAEVS